MSKEHIQQFLTLMHRKRLSDLSRQVVQRRGAFAQEAERLERDYLERLYGRQYKRGDTRENFS